MGGQDGRGEAGRCINGRSIGRFDLCDHQILLEKLKLMGLEQKAASWMESYLTGRSQSTLVEGHQK